MTQSRIPDTTVTFIDNYCSAYEKLFPEVRSYEAFKRLHLGMAAEIKRKTLPAIAKAVGLKNEQSLLHFLTESPGDVKEVRKQRLKIILQTIKGEEIILIIDETGDKKKGKTTDYVERQYIGNLGKIENGIVSVNAYGIWQGITFPLLFRIYKPKKRLKGDDIYKTKTQLAAEIITELQEMGFKFELVLADSLYGESDTFLSVLNQYKIPFIVAIRSNHGVLMPSTQRVRFNKEIVSSDFLMVSLQFSGLNQTKNIENDSPDKDLLLKLCQHPWWNHISGWNHRLNNLRLILLPYIYYCLLKPWIQLFNNRYLRIGFRWLIQIMNEFIGFIFSYAQSEDLSFFSP